MTRRFVHGIEIKLFERIVRTDYFAMSFNGSRLKRRERIVDLECGHKAVTTAVHKCRCARCEEMLYRSITTGLEDYESFRHGDKSDTMEWTDDRVCLLNEPHDLDGNRI